MSDNVISFPVSRAAAVDDTGTRQWSGTRVFGENGSGIAHNLYADAESKLFAITRSLNTAEASEMLGIRPATLRGWKAQRIGPPFIQLSPRCVRYAEDDILRYANERRVVPSVRETRETS